jgi:DNA adenine methylase
LQQLQQLQQLTFYRKSYEQIEIKENSIIYCDPPYKNTADYQNSFNTEKFLNWADFQKEPVFISEYNISDKRFKLIKTIKKRSLFSSNKEKCKTMSENIYINKAGQNKFL